MTGPTPAQDPYSQAGAYGQQPAPVVPYGEAAPSPHGGPQYGGAARSPYGGLPSPYGAGPIGRVRPTGVCILLSIVTLGIYGLYWYFSTHEEMKRHTGTGLGGGIALLLAFFVGIAMPYITSSEVGGLYARRGQAPPVSGVTGLWYFPGIFLFFIGPIVWFVKTNGALNAYWRSVGAAG